MINESAVIAEFATTYAKPEDGIKILPSEGKEGDLAASIALGKMRLDQQAFDKMMPSWMKNRMNTYSNPDEV